MVHSTNQVSRSISQSYADVSVGLQVVSNCLDLLIWQDPYTEQLIRSRPSSGSPLIHRGYWSRVEAIRQSVLRFVQEAPAKEGVQVVTRHQVLWEYGWSIGVHSGSPPCGKNRDFESVGSYHGMFCHFKGGM